MGARRASVTAVAAVVLGVLVVAVLVTWAASIGPSGVLRGDGPERHPLNEVSEASSLEVPSESEDPINEEEEEGTGNDAIETVLRIMFVVLGVAVVVALIFLGHRAARWARQAYDARFRPPPPPEEVEFDVLEGRRRIVEEMEQDAGEQRQVLLQGTPRNGIVECWHRFERQAAEAGLERQNWETSSEFTLRMLEIVSADSGAVAGLAQLYREARFSHHPLDEEARSRAVAALDAVHAGLTSPAGGVSG